MSESVSVLYIGYNMFHIKTNDLYVNFPATRGFPLRAKGIAPGFNALSGVAFTVRSGDRVGVVGKNGAGKSTLLRALAGIYPPTHGHIETVGKISSMFNMGLGMQLDYSGMRNIHISNLISGVPPHLRKKALSDIVDFCELGGFLNNPVRTYSSGMGMRLKFACATTLNPEILLLDEWVGAGDEEFQTKATKRMHGLVENSGIVVLATHNIPLMKKICNKALWLDEGRIVQFGDIDDVLGARTESMKK